MYYIIIIRYQFMPHLGTTFIPFGEGVGDRNFPIHSVRSGNLGEDVFLDIPVVIYRQKVKEVFVSALLKI